MKFINRKTGEEKKVVGARGISRVLYSPIEGRFGAMSHVMDDIIKKYENVPLTPYKPTAGEQEQLKQNPDFIQDLPTVYIKGFDKEAGSDLTGKKIFKEFCERLEKEDAEVIRLINRSNPYVKVVL